MSRLLQRKVTWFLLALAVVGLSACRTERRETFDLSQARVMAHEAAPAKLRSTKNIQLLIGAPNALKIFDGQEIVIERGGSLSYLKGAQFGDRLPNMLQTRLIQAFEDANRLGGVSRPGEGLAINYQLLSDIRAFAIKTGEGSGAAYARIELGVKLMDDRTGQVKAARVFTATSMISGSDNRAYVQGLERALSDILVQLVNWAFDYL